MSESRRQWEVTAGVPRPGKDFPGASRRSVRVSGPSFKPEAGAESGPLLDGYALSSVASTPRGDGLVERQLDRFCWGGFLWGGLWAVYHRVWLGLFALIPILGLPVCLVLGLRGRRWAWERCRHRDINRFFLAQYRWGLSWVFAAPVLLPATMAAGAAGLFLGQEYLQRQQIHRARAQLAELGRGLARCASQARHQLPAGSAWVPARLALVAGRRFEVSELEWRSQPAFDCADFAPREAVSFQFRWLADAASIGKAVARADFDGDGLEDQRLSVVVTCGETACESSPPIFEALLPISGAASSE